MEFIFDLIGLITFEINQIVNAFDFSKKNFIIYIIFDFVM